MPVINTNVNALLATNALTYNSRVQASAMQQLSTGSRINSAKDDAAGLAIGSKMTAQIRGLDMAVRNANDGISLLQTAEGATNTMTDMLQRMRELSVQASTDTNTAGDRDTLNGEFQQLKTEITRIAANTQWNGMDILNGNNSLGAVDGNQQTVKFQVGANADQTIEVNFKDFTFTPGTTSASASTATLNLAANTTTSDEAGRFQATIGGVAVNIDITLMGADPSNGDATTLAAELQAGIRAVSGLENVNVTATGEVLSFTNSNGGVFAAFGFTQADNSATTDDLVAGATYSAAGNAQGAARPAGGVFTGNAQIDSIDVTSLGNANSATTALDAALSAVGAERAKFGAVMNRLTYAADNLTNVSQNATESRSRVLDTDYAAATTKLAKSQIISQAATAMLAQANQQQQSVLALLK